MQTLKKSRPIAIGLFMFWLLLVAISIHLLIEAQIAHRKSEFLHKAQAITSDLSVKLNSNEVVLAGFSAFLQAIHQDAPALATKFATELTRAYPHIHMLEVARKVPLDERNKLESTLRKIWRQDFSIKNFAEIKQVDSHVPESPNEVWPVVFLHPVSPEVEPIYGVDLQTVAYLSTALTSAHHHSMPVVSSVFDLYEGGRAYMLLQEVSFPSNSKTSADSPSIFGSTNLALLLIKTDALLPTQQQAQQGSNLDYRATLLSSDGTINNLLFEGLRPTGKSLNHLFLPNFQHTDYIENRSQPVMIEFSQQVRWTDLLGWGNLPVMALFALTLCFVPWLKIFHLRALATAEREQDRSIYLATHDTLTALPNRIVLADRFHQLRENWKRHGTPFALALIDLDGFKKVNDQYGHGVGDEVLKAIASRFTKVLRSVDTITRYGGDEFIVLLAEVSSTSESELIGQKILAAAAQSIETTAGPMQIGCSIGVSIFPDHGQSLETLRNRADQAMYQSKQQGGEGISFFTPT